MASPGPADSQEAAVVEVEGVVAMVVEVVTAKEVLQPQLQAAHTLLLA
ncbi:hypothetical protein GCM10023158_31660 [Gluconacetobacter tumulicola]